MKEKLNILWTSGDVITGENMVFMYGINAVGKKWWDEVRIILWGSSTNLVATNEKIQDLVRIALENGVKITACEACVNNLNHREIIEKLGIEIKFWGEGLTEIIKNEEKLITI